MDLKLIVIEWSGCQAQKRSCQLRVVRPTSSLATLRQRHGGSVACHFAAVDSRRHILRQVCGLFTEIPPFIFTQLHRAGSFDCWGVHGITPRLFKAVVGIPTIIVVSGAFEIRAHPIRTLQTCRRHVLQAIVGRALVAAHVAVGDVAHRETSQGQPVTDME